jgi:single-strand DNA-binding protein
MSLRINNVVLGGVVGRDPELKSTASGKQLANFSIAVDNGRDKETDWFDVTAWDKMAEIAGKYVTKGSVVVVIGRLSQNKWEDKTDGKKHSKSIIVASNIQLVGGKRKEEDGTGEGVGSVVIDDSSIPF